MSKTKIKVGVLSICAVALSYMALSPVLADIGREFSGVSETMVQMIITLPNLLFIVSSPISGYIMGYVNKKTIALASLCCYLVGGLFPFFFNSNIWQLLVGSAIIGLGLGFMMPLINGFIVQYFDKEEQAALMGLNATCTAIGALTFIFMGGQLARFGWRYTYLVFTLVIVIIILVAAFMPKGEPQKHAACESTEQNKSSQFEMNPYILGIFIIGIMYFTIQNAFNTNSSAFVADVLGKGASVASLVTMVNTLGGIVGGAMFRGIVMKTRNHIETFTLAIVGIGFIIPFLIHHFVAIIIGSLFVGYGFALFNAAGTYLLAQNTRPETNAFTVSVYLALINLGGAFSPILVNFCAGIIGDGVAVKFIFAGIVIEAVAVYSLVLNSRKSSC